MAGIDTTPSLVATNALQAIPFGSIIGAPLSACIEAQAKAAKTSWEFIKAVGLTDTDDGKGKQAIYVNFEFRKNGQKTTLSVPLLTIVPIPYLAIKDIDIAFKANISSSASNSQTDFKSLEMGASMYAEAGFDLGIVNGKMEMSAYISSKKDSTATRDSKYSVEYTMDVNVKAGQDDMPAGMAKVLEILNESIDTINTNGELSISEQFLRLQSPNGENTEKSASTYIAYKNPDGYFKPEEIMVYKYKPDTKEENGVVTADECDITKDEIGAQCKFKAEGYYMVKAAEREAIVIVK